MPVAIRPCEATDFPFVVRCMLALAAENPARSRMSLDQAKDMMDYFAAKPDAGRLLLLEQEGGIVGYAILAMHWRREVFGTVVSIEELYVTPAARRRGVGSEFLLWLHKQWAGRAKAVRFEVGSAEPRLHTLCKRLGFEVMPIERAERSLLQPAPSLAAQSIELQPPVRR